MIESNPMQLKAMVKNESKLKGISAQLVMQNYMMERLLERISLSSYKSNFILKGGFLIAAIVGLDTRATMDLDTTIKGFQLTQENIKKIFYDICSIEAEDDIIFEITACADIRENDEYPGIRISFLARYQTLSVPVSVDITTGDRITPSEVEFKINLLFEERKINILAYNIETILAEKIETVLSRGIANTRTRDFYDIYILHLLKSKKYSTVTLKKALEETSRKRGSGSLIRDYEKIIKSLEADEQINRIWNRYRSEFSYAKDISFSSVCTLLLELCRKVIEKTENKHG